MNPDQKILFISGLHRSGTTLLHQLLRDQPKISGFSDTGVMMDEGQYLQTVFPVGRKFGGPGRFGFRRESIMTETHPLATGKSREQLLAEWTPYWDMSKQILLEKSPPNILRTRFLQKLFPEAKFLVIVRHPIAVSLATQKWSRTSLSNLLKHWATVHTRFWKDKPMLNHLCLLSYEYLVHHPKSSAARLSDFLSIPVNFSQQPEDHNLRYFDRWNEQHSRARIRRHFLQTKYERQVRDFGYSFRDLDAYPSFLGDSADR